MLKLQQLLDEECRRIDEELALEDPKVLYYQEFCQKYNIKEITDLENVDPCDLVIFYLASTKEFEDMDVIKDAIYSNRKFIENLRVGKSLPDLIDAIEKVEKEGATQCIRDIFAYKKGTNPIDLVKKEYRSALPILRIVVTNHGNVQAFAKILDLTTTSSSLVMQALSIRPLLFAIKRDSTKYENVSKNYKNYVPKEHYQAIDEGLISLVRRVNAGEDFVTEHTTAAINSFEERTKKQQNKRKSLMRNKVAYENLISKLNEVLQGKSLVEVNGVLSKIANKDIRLEVLKLIYKHNEETYSDVSEAYNRLSRNTQLQYQQILARYGLSQNELDPNTIMGKSPEEIDKMLTQLSKFGLTSPKTLIRILQNSNLEVVSRYTSLVEKGIISTKLLANYEKLFDEQSVEYSDFSRNLDYLQEQKINLNYLGGSQKTFLMPHETLVKGIKTLEEYGLITAMKKSISYDFLESPNLAESIDYLLELGYEESLEERIDLLNHQNHFARLQVLKALNIPVETTEELFKVLITPNFLVSDDSIDSYIYNATGYKLFGTDQIGETSEPIDLNNFSNTTRTYNFGGVLISKNKVKRNLDNGQTTLLDGIVQGSILSDEELNQVLICLDQNKSFVPVKSKES